ncbi:molybdenum cofactor guanylyltransferase MobA [Candidatus Thiodictyon syntrophicum]|jgi:molybdopterin-guanine dinucleotide biosynthesis protein A|uniref:Molybdenum cofactor guanylyltransferase n=1 Tax=Candidatus Thiodictyon syntrophicum TaxID=1166950 RepID=A0A2K8UIY5_9GAMM|nr:molybdenum cofactor guanylyltransferase MobA [Candidatus Thiodictyon syntrophicum]AUB85485.1 molybdenum cofactor guanylyltransferase MobA [Candidatus Thiodictyon syntrophicum]
MHTPSPSRAAITGVILAGGQSSRLGGHDKGLRPFAGRPLVEWVIAALAPQVDTLLISANRNLERYADYGLPVVADLDPGFQGPLAGIRSAMRAAATAWIITLPCDGPYPAPDLVARLLLALRTQAGDLAVATDGQRLQPVHALLPVALATDLETFLAAGERKPTRWYDRHRVALADFSDRPDCFANINTPDDALALERRPP